MRLERRKRTNIEYKGQGGITDAFDDAIKQFWRVNDQEYDFVCEEASDEDLNKLITNQNPSFKEKRDILVTLEKYMTLYSNSKI